MWYLVTAFSETWLIWADYVEKLDVIVDMYDPDIVICECVERVDRSEHIEMFANRLQKKNDWLRIRRHELCRTQK